MLQESPAELEMALAEQALQMVPTRSRMAHNKSEQGPSRRVGTDCFSRHLSDISLKALEEVTKTGYYAIYLFMRIVPQSAPSVYSNGARCRKLGVVPIIVILKQVLDFTVADVPIANTALHVTPASPAVSLQG